MSIIGWLAFGLLAGVIANAIVYGRRCGILLDLTLGTAGAMTGGIMFTALGDVSFTGFNLYSMFIAVIGAVVALLTYHALFVYGGNFDD